MKRLGRVSLRWIVPGIALACLLPPLILFGIDDLRHEREIWRRSMHADAQSILQLVVRFLAAPTASGPETRYRELVAWLPSSKVVGIDVVGEDGRVLLAADAARIGGALTRVDPASGAAFARRESQRLAVDSSSDRVIAFAPWPAPVPAAAQQAWLVMVLDFARDPRLPADHFLRQALVGSGAILFGALLIWLWLDRLFTRPLRALQGCVQRMAEGWRERPAYGFGFGEIAELGRVFEGVADELRRLRQSEQRQQRLYAALSDTNQNIVRARGAKPMLEETCRIGVSIGFRLAWIARLDKVGTLRVDAAAGPAAFRLEGAGGAQRLGADPFAEAVRAGRELILPFTADRPSPWEDEARGHGLAGGAAFPLTGAGELIGGLVVLTDDLEYLDRQALDILREIADDVAFGLVTLDNENARDRMERRLEEERALLRALVDSIPDLIFFKDHSHVYLGCNRAFAQLVGRSEGELLGANEFDLLEPAQAQRFREQDEQVLKSGERIRFEQWVEYPDGRRMLLDTLKTPFTGADGNVLGLIGIGRDITDLRRQLEQQLALEKQLRQTQKMEAVGQLTGGIAHDFNNILASILGFAELARRRDLGDDEKLRDYLHRIHLAARRGTDLIAQLLTFSRGGSTDQSMPMDPGPMVKETLKLLRATLPAGIQLHTDIEADLPQIVMDPVHLNQVVMNLCINARDALGEKGEITVGLHRMRDFSGTCNACGRTFAGHWVVLSVADNGPGIAAQHHPHLFEPFYTTKPQGKGSGMGLSVVHGIQLSYGGHVLLESEPGAGSRFQLLYPISARRAPAVASDPRTADPGGWQFPRRTRVMVVDDEPSITVYLKEFLELQGLQVEAFTDSPKALERLQQAAGLFHLLITDQAMPELTGLELVQAAKRADPGLPVILCSGYSVGINAGNAAEHGVDRYLDKPVTPQDLLPHIRAVMRKDDQGE